MSLDLFFESILLFFEASPVPHLPLRLRASDMSFSSSSSSFSTSSDSSYSCSSSYPPLLQIPLLECLRRRKRRRQNSEVAWKRLQVFRQKHFTEDCHFFGLYDRFHLECHTPPFSDKPFLTTRILSLLSLLSASPSRLQSLQNHPPCRRACAHRPARWCVLVILNPKP